MFKLLNWACVLISLAAFERAKGDFLPPFWIQEAECCDTVCHTQAMGPFFEAKTSADAGWMAWRPLRYDTWNVQEGTRQTHCLYPLISRYQSQDSMRVNIFGIIQHRTHRSCAGDSLVVDDERMVFPFYFYRNTGNPQTSYRGIFPLGGDIRNFLGYDRVHWAMFPLFIEMQKPYEVRTAMPWPFVQWLSGPQSRGFALWPLGGRFVREGHYRHEYFLWPFVYNFWDNLDKPVPRHRFGILPFYTKETSENIQQESFPWPFMGYIYQRDPAYYERQYFWPLFVQGRGEGHIVNRWAPFYTYSLCNGHEKQWVLWPLAKIQRWHEGELCIQRSQALYFFVWHETQCSRNQERPFYAEKTHVWPLASYWDNGCGRIQLQVLSPLEVFFPHNEVVRRLYSPLFALYRYDKDAYGNKQQSWLFNLVILEQTACSSRFAIGPLFETQSDCQGEGFQFLKGLIGFSKRNGKNTLKLFWMNW